MDNRAVRMPAGSRHNLFQGQPARRQNPTTVRPDHDVSGIFQQPQEDELVERTENGEYSVAAPQAVYRNVATGMGNEAHEEIEQENELIDLYDKPNAHWDAATVEQEIKGALKSSLRKKVASIKDDKWMFQAESDIGRK
ncbi:hypothetical protein ACN47E_008077 [Coniothyrium glycines]